MMRLPIVLVLVLAAGGGGVAAQQGLVDVEVEPITCWWRSSTSAVRSGEPFTLRLTCAVIETETIVYRSATGTVRRIHGEHRELAKFHLD